MRRFVAIAFALAIVPLAVSSCEDDDEVDPRIEQGRQLYAQYCALCHGDSGEGYAADAANALSNQQFLAIASDELIRKGTERGRPGTAMGAWGQSRGGPLDDAQLDAVTAFIRNWQTGDSIDPAALPGGSGEAARGEAVYNVHCVSCHGEEGQGGDYMSVANPEFLAIATDGFLRHTTMHGRSGTTMAAYQAELTQQNIDDVVALIRSWQRPIDEGPFVPPSKDLGDPILNPDGPDPGFPTEGRFLPVAELYAAYEAGARLLILDARPPADYVHNHIAGSVSVPFYEAEDYLDQIPQDVWIVSYCACPHAESGALADALMANGYNQVKVLDEGLPLWEDSGYPMNSGPAP